MIDLSDFKTINDIKRLKKISNRVKKVRFPWLELQHHLKI